MRWIDVKVRLPECRNKRDSFGEPIIVWPYFDVQDNTTKPMRAYYGCRVTRSPSFYLHGLVLDVTHWMPMPEPPMEDATKGAEPCNQPGESPGALEGESR